MPRTGWTIPPRIKILEAAGAIADGRLRLIENGALVTSSSGRKVYRVVYDPAVDAINSNDNGSFYIGYTGYPMLAFLMVTNILPYDKAIGELLTGIHWKKLNSKHDNNYAAVEDEIMAHLTDVEKIAVEKFIESTMAILETLHLAVLEDDTKPPSGW